MHEFALPHGMLAIWITLDCRHVGANVPLGRSTHLPSSRRLAAICAFETFERRLESTQSRHSRSPVDGEESCRRRSPRNGKIPPKASLQTDSISYPGVRSPLRRSSRCRCVPRKQPAGGFAACQGRKPREHSRTASTGSDFKRPRLPSMPQPARRRLTLPMDLSLEARPGTY